MTLNHEVPQPRVFENTGDWHALNRAWQSRPPLDVRGAVSPDVAEAASGHTLTITLRLGNGVTLSTGAHVTVEIPEAWDAHLGNTFRRGIKTVGARQQVQNGYGAFAEVSCSNPAVRLALVASYGRLLDLLDVVVQQGELRSGDALWLTLGTPDGNLLQAQKFAQVAVFTTGVDLVGDGTYQRAAVHPTVQVVGATADRFRVFAPGVVQPGAPFTVRVLPVDVYSFNPAPRYRGTAQVVTSPGLEAPASVTIGDAAATGEYGMAGAALTATATAPGVQRLTVVDAAHGLIGRSNPIGAGFLPDRGIYFGELHSQMWESMGSGRTEEFFRWGRDVAGLDFCAPANHYGRRFEVTGEVWSELVATCNRFDQPGRFATLVSYEWGGSRQPSGWAHGTSSGHKNVYYRGAWGEFHQWQRQVHATPEDLWRALDRLAERDGRSAQDVSSTQDVPGALTVPHHTRAMGGVDWGYRNDRFQRLVEICSQWGISEQGGPHSVQSALGMGHRLGFVGGTDSHHGLANQGEYHVNDGNGLACVQATALTRDAIWQALYDRRCYATTGDRILLDFQLNGRPMGADLPVDLDGYGPRRLTWKVAGTAEIDRVEVLRNNQVVYTAAPHVEDWEGEWTDGAPLRPLALEPTFAYDRPFVFYYLRVTQANRQMAWASPIWLTQAP